MNISIEGNLQRALLQFNEDLPKVLNYLTAEVAHKFADYTKRNYLLGQALHKRTGRTYNSVKFFKKKNMQMGVRPGVGVRGNLNYLNKWIGTEHEFMAPAARSFQNSGRADKVANFIMRQTIRKKGF